jgi:outer membrane protein
MTRRTILGALFLLVPAALAAQPAGTPPQPVRMTFSQVIDAALTRNVSVRQAAEEILRAQALLREATAAILPGASASLVTTTLNQGRDFNGSVTTPRNQLTASLTISAPLYAPVLWAERVHAADDRQVAELSAAETRRQVAFAAAQAYLAIIARVRVVDANVRARDVAREHYALARQLREMGAGSRLNELRAQQALSSDEALLQEVELSVYQAQEALGVLVAEVGPVAAADDPPLDVPGELAEAEDAMLGRRTDLLLAAGRERAAARVVSDSWKDWLPSVSGLFQPLYTTPQTIFQPSFSWRAQILVATPLFDGGSRGARRASREVTLRESTLAKDQLTLEARSEERAARESLRRTTQALASIRAAADQAHQVVDIVNVSFKAGASTNIEVIDAQRVARDADLAVAIAEDQVRQARLALLVALGLFPQP